MTATGTDPKTGNLLVRAHWFSRLGLSDPPPFDRHRTERQPAWSEVVGAGVNFARNYSPDTEAGMLLLDSVVNTLKEQQRLDSADEVLANNFTTVWPAEADTAEVSDGLG